jgi:mono/diheme cytochrome c family protein
MHHEADDRGGAAGADRLFERESRAQGGSRCRGAPDEGAKLFAARCGGCHDLPDVKSRGNAEWASEVKRMVQQKGAKAIAEEEALIVRYLQQANGRN